MYLQNRNFGFELSMRSNHHEGKHDYAEHIHQFMEVLFVLKGSIEVDYNGLTQTAHEGDLAVIPPFQRHSYHTPEYCKIWVGVISSDWVADFFPLDSFPITKTAVFTPSPAVLAYVKENIPYPHGILKATQISQEMYRKTKALYYAILNEYFLKTTLTESLLHTDALSSLYMYVYKHYKEPITLKETAAAIGYTPNYISHCLSVIPNTNFRTLVNSARLEHAKKLLSSTEMKIIDIALDSGFLSESVFYDVFVKHTGMTPRTYRLNKRNSNIEKYSTLMP